MNVPIISLEIQGMKHTIKTALMQEVVAIDKGVQEALEAMCSDGNVSRIVQQEAKIQIEAALKEEVKDFFYYTTNGREAIKEAVREYLEVMYPAKGKE